MLTPRGPTTTSKWGASLSRASRAACGRFWRAGERSVRLRAVQAVFAAERAACPADVTASGIYARQELLPLVPPRRAPRRSAHTGATGYTRRFRDRLTLSRTGDRSSCGRLHARAVPVCLGTPRRFRTQACPHWMRVAHSWARAPASGATLLESGGTCATIYKRMSTGRSTITTA
eukprot:217334-Chlamydomonas_euryale.AAC.1